MRIGKFVEHFKAAAIAIDNKSPIDPVLRYLAVGRQLGYAGYLTFDAIGAIDVIGIKKLESAKKLQENAYRCWMAGLIFSAISGLYSLWRLQEKEKTVDRKEGEGVVEAKKIEKYVPCLLSSGWMWLILKLQGTLYGPYPAPFRCLRFDRTHFRAQVPRPR